MFYEKQEDTYEVLCLYTLTFFSFTCGQSPKNIGIKTNVALGSENLKKRGYYTQNPEQNEMVLKWEFICL